MCHNSQLVLWSPRAATTKPTCCNYLSPSSWSPCFTTREATMISLSTALKSSRFSLKLEKSLCSSKDLVQTEIKASVLEKQYEEVVKDLFHFTKIQLCTINLCFPPKSTSQRRLKTKSLKKKIKTT